MAQSVTSPVACSFDHVFWGKSYTLMEGQKEKTFDPTPGPGEGHTSLTPWPHPPCPKRGLHTTSAIPTSPLSFSGVLGAAHVQENQLNSRPGQRDRGPAGRLTGYCLGQICTNFKHVSLFLEVFQTKFCFGRAVEFSFRNHFIMFRHSVFKNSRE